MKSQIIPRLITLALMVRAATFHLHAADPTAPATPAPAIALPVPPAPAPAESATPTASNSRYIFMPPIDDDGKSSGFHAVTICLPAGYDSTDSRYPVIYVLDGESCFLTRKNGMTDTIAYEMVHDQLVHEGLIQPAIFVAIHNGSDASGTNMVKRNRVVDYMPASSIPKQSINKSKADGYFEFLSKKIKPMIDQTYRTLPEPASTGVAGFSASGMGAFWMAYVHPEVFGMGLCQSPAVRKVKEFVNNHQGPIPHVRLWIDAGSRETEDANGLLKASYDVVRTLTKQGFRLNDNLGFQIGHDHGHEKFDCTRRMRAALYFLLRLKTPVLTGAAIVDVDSPEDSIADKPMPLGRLGRAEVEVEYDHWFRLIDCTASLKVANPAIVTLDGTDNGLQPRSPGETSLSASFDGRKLTRKVTVLPPIASLPCPAVKKPVTVDGDLSEWPQLPYVVNAPRKSTDASRWTGPADLSYRFACAHDNKFLYIAIQTTDDIIKSDPDKAPWEQDGVEVRIDARPPSERLSVHAKTESDEILLVAMSPAQAGETRLPYKDAILPLETKAVCKVTSTGYNTEIAIPFSYLDEMAGKPWSDVRINICVNDFDNDYRGFTGDKFWWQADWRSTDTMWGSGTFKRK